MESNEGLCSVLSNNAECSYNNLALPRQATGLWSQKDTVDYPMPHRLLQCQVTTVHVHVQCVQHTHVAIMHLL